MCKYLHLLRDSQKGFNLLEVLLVTVIIAIGAAVAVPSLVGQRINNELKEDTDELYGAIVFAIANANRESSDLTITFPSSAGGETTAVLANGNQAFIGEAVMLNDHVSVNGITNLTYDFRGFKTSNSGNEETLIISSTDTPNQYCIVFGLMPLAKGVVDSSGNCINAENLRYDNSL